MLDWKGGPFFLSFLQDWVEIFHNTVCTDACWETLVYYTRELLLKQLPDYTINSQYQHFVFQYRYGLENERNMNTRHSSTPLNMTDNSNPLVAKKGGKLILIEMKFSF